MHLVFRAHIRTPDDGGKYATSVSAYLGVGEHRKWSSLRNDKGKEDRGSPDEMTRPSPPRSFILHHSQATAVRTTETAYHTKKEVQASSKQHWSGLASPRSTSALDSARLSSVASASHCCSLSL